MKRECRHVGNRHRIHITNVVGKFRRNIMRAAKQDDVRAQMYRAEVARMCCVMFRSGKKVEHKRGRYPIAGRQNITDYGGQTITIRLEIYTLN